MNNIEAVKQIVYPEAYCITCRLKLEVISLGVNKGGWISKCNHKKHLFSEIYNYIFNWNLIK